MIEGKFITPLELYIPGIAPEACKQAQFQMILPLKWSDENYKPVCVHFAGTGDHVSIFLNHKILKFFNSVILLFSFIGVEEILWQNHYYEMLALDQFY